MMTPWGSAPTNAYLNKTESFRFWLSGHLIFDRKNYFWWKKSFNSEKQELCFFEKKTFSFFLGRFFQNIVFSKFPNFSRPDKLGQKFFLIKMKMFFSKKTKFVFMGTKSFFSKIMFFVKKYVSTKLSVLKNENFQFFP
jgi:hypothetical protein